MKRREYRETTNRSLYAKYRKRFLAQDGDINCERCPYHWNENADRGSKIFDVRWAIANHRWWANIRKPRPWKNKTRNRHQFGGSREKFDIERK